MNVNISMNRCWKVISSWLALWIISPWMGVFWKWLNVEVISSRISKWYLYEWPKVISMNGFGKWYYKIIRKISPWMNEKMISPSMTEKIIFPWMTKKYISLMAVWKGYLHEWAMWESDTCESMAFNHCIYTIHCVPQICTLYFLLSKVYKKNKK